MKSLLRVITNVILVAIITFPFTAPIVYIYIISPFQERLIYLRYRYFPFSHRPDIIRTLVQYFPYYNKLNKHNRRKFETRLLIFMASKKFTGRLGLVLTERMKILVSASAIQLTFGLSYFMLRKFHYIYLYPDSYYYKHYKVKFRGHVSDYGMIHLSWNNFEKGYLFPEDGVNLGLHELMHALKMHALEFQVDFTFHENNAIIERLASVEMLKVKSKSIEFLKNRLVHNKDEFLSVCAECFFELPEQFNRELPEVYFYMKQLLNQDPLRADNPPLGIYFQGGLHSGD